MEDRSSLKKYHTTVMLEEAVEYLLAGSRSPAESSESSTPLYIDATLGEGGHSEMLLNRMPTKCRLLSIDQDIEAINFVKRKYHDLLDEGRWILVNENFAKIDQIVRHVEEEEQMRFTVHGVLFDLGMSSRQLDYENRGFSYKESNSDQPLDMRMDTRLGVKASDLLAVLDVKQLASIIREYGEERYASKIARTIKEYKAGVQTVRDLNEVIRKAIPVASPALLTKTQSRVYQALRIAVNSELDSLSQALTSAYELLAYRGRLAVISFHSLEDRIVKKFFNEQVGEGHGVLITDEVIKPDEKEVSKNQRARSAKLRVIEKS